MNFLKKIKISPCYKVVPIQSSFPKLNHMIHRVTCFTKNNGTYYFCFWCQVEYLITYNFSNRTKLKITVNQVSDYSLHNTSGSKSNQDFSLCNTSVEGRQPVYCLYRWLNFLYNVLKPYNFITMLNMFMADSQSQRFTFEFMHWFSRHNCPDLSNFLVQIVT